MNRDEQIELLKGAAERNQRTAASWREDARVREAVKANIDRVKRLRAEHDHPPGPVRACG